ncbi:MAG: GxxExxY protein [Saprospiraceae bacterium]
MLYKEECFKIIGMCMEVHKILGPGLLEIVYKDALEIELKQNEIPFWREKQFQINYKGKILPRKYIADFVAFNDIILEIKADTNPLDNHLRQTLNYLALAKSPLGLIINFGEGSLQYKRVLKSGNIDDRHFNNS